MVKSTRVVVAVFAVLAVVIGGAALAWACGAQAQIKNSPNYGVAGHSASGATGSVFSVSGSNFRSGPVEIHWNAVNGPLLATPSGPSFSVSVTVPYDQAAGTYYVVAVQEGVGSPSDAFTVTGTAAPQESGPPSASGGEPQPAEKTKTLQSASGAESQKPSDKVGDGQSTKSGDRSSTSSDPVSSSPATATTSSGQTVFAPSVSGGADSKAKQAKEAPKPGAPSSTPGAPSVESPERLYSGLESPSVLPSPIDSSVVPSGGSSSLLTLGVGLLSVGLVAMFGGFLFAEVRRRRVTAGARGSQLK